MQETKWMKLEIRIILKYCKVIKVWFLIILVFFTGLYLALVRTCVVLSIRIRFFDYFKVSDLDQILQVGGTGA